MRFTASEDFRHQRTTFEAGNSYDANKQGVSESEVREFWARGWVEVEGWEPSPERQPGASTARPDNATHTSREQ